jgi:hypothetical protein
MGEMLWGGGVERRLAHARGSVRGWVTGEEEGRGGRRLVAEPEVDDGEGEEGGVEAVEPAAVTGEHAA